MRVGLVRRLGQLESRRRTLTFSRVVRVRWGQSTADAVVQHLHRIGCGAGEGKPLVIVPLPARSVAEWLEQHAPP